jgi:hypothetical protein
MLTALDVLQPPPLRAALSRLWVVYLYTTDTSRLVTAAAWLLDQLRVLQAGTQQSVVLAECAALVLAEFRAALLPLAPDCAANLMRLSQNVTNPATTVVASHGLVALTTGGTTFLGTLKNDLATKTAIPLIESKSARLRINGIFILINLLRNTLTLGTIAHKNLKTRVETLLESSCREERDAAAQLLALLTVFKPSGEAKTTEAIVESWVRLADRHPENSIHTAKVLLEIMKYSNDFGKILSLTVKEHPLSLAIVPESKKRIWKIQQGHFALILADLHTVIPKTALVDVAKVLLKNVADAPLLYTLFPWYLDSVKAGRITLTESDLLCLPQKLSSAERLSRLTSDRIAEIVTDSSMRLRLIISIFAQLKGDWTLLGAGDPSANPATFSSYGIVLAALLSAIPTLGLDHLYRSNDLFEQIRDWVLSVLGANKKGSIEHTCWDILGALVTTSPELIDLLGLAELIIEKSPPPAPPTTPTTSGSLSPSIKTTIELDIGCSIFIRKVFLSNAAMAHREAFIKSISVFIVEQWRACARVSDIVTTINAMDLAELASSTLLIINDVDGAISEVSATVASRVICNFPAKSEYQPLFDDCQKLLKIYFGRAAVAGQKYHLSQFSIYIKSAPLRENIFRTVSNLLSVISLSDKTEEDRNFMLDTLKQIIFPIVCDAEAELQLLAAKCLGRLVALVGTRSFRDGMLQELLDRALNEAKEAHRRGYVLGIGQVYASFPEHGSRLDISSIIGLLSSLAKDGRSIIVQAAAIDALHTVLDARSNSVASILTSDIVYLIWQVYVSDPNAIFVESAVEKALLDSIARTLLVLLEMLGPDLTGNGTVPRICRLVVGEFLEYDCENSKLLKVFFEAALQVLLVCQRTEGGLFSLLATLGTALAAKDPRNLSSAISCLRWLLQFHRESVLSYVTSNLVISLLDVGIESSQDLEYCVQVLFDARFTSEPQEWLALVRNSTIVACPIAQRSTGSNVSLEHEVGLLNELDINGTEAQAKSGKSLSNVEAVEKVGSLIITFLDRYGVHISNIWDSDISTNFVTELIRQSLALLLSPASMYSRRLKLLGIKLVSSLVRNVYSVRDWVDSDSYFLDTFQSQLVTIYSTGCQDEDALVAAEAHAAFNSLLSIEIIRDGLGRHPKVTGLVTKAVTFLHSDRMFGAEPVELYCKTIVLASLINLDWKFGNEQQRSIKDAVRWCLLQAVDMFINNDLDDVIISSVPIIISMYLKGAADEYLDTGVMALLLQAPPSASAINALSDLLVSNRKLDAVHVRYIVNRALHSGDHETYASLLKVSLHLDDVFSSKLVSKIVIDLDRLPDPTVLQAVSKLDVTIITKFWPIIIQSLNKLLIDSGYFEARDITGPSYKGEPFHYAVVVDLFKTKLSKIQYQELCAILFSGPAGDCSKLQMLEMLAPLVENSIFTHQATILLRSLLASIPEEAGSTWVTLLKSSPLCKRIAINSLDVFLNLAHAKSDIERGTIARLVGDRLAHLVTNLS